VIKLMYLFPHILVSVVLPQLPCLVFSCIRRTVISTTQVDFPLPLLQLIHSLFAPGPIRIPQERIGK